MWMLPTTSEATCFDLRQALASRRGPFCLSLAEALAGAAAGESARWTCPAFDPRHGTLCIAMECLAALSRCEIAAWTRSDLGDAIFAILRQEVARGVRRGGEADKRYAGKDRAKRHVPKIALDRPKASPLRLEQRSMLKTSKVQDGLW